jgi:hypothetical protein
MPAAESGKIQVGIVGAKAVVQVAGHSTGPLDSTFMES